MLITIRYPNYTFAVFVSFVQTNVFENNAFKSIFEKFFVSPWKWCQETQNRLLSLFSTCLCITKPLLIKTIFVVTISVICLNLKNFQTDDAHVLCYETFFHHDGDNTKPLFFFWLSSVKRKKERPNHFLCSLWKWWKTFWCVYPSLTKFQTSLGMVGKLR